MKHALLGLGLLCALLGFGFAGKTLGNGALSGDPVPAMMASPSTIVLAKVDSVTVHTNIPASIVDPDSLYLNGAAPYSVYADCLGHIAAKFQVSELHLVPGQATLTLGGAFVSGDEFTASDVVTVK